MAVIRLDKLLSESGAATRSEARSFIKQGKVFVDGHPVKSFDMKLDPALATVTVDGRVLSYQKFRYVMMNKPAGVISATEDSAQETAVGLLPPVLQRQGLFPAGRLDKDTTGLLILTNDGDFAHRLMSPRHKLEKVYLARVDKEIEKEDIEAFLSGITLADGTQCLPARLEAAGEDLCRVSICEGKYHQVKRMLASRGKKVLSLHRLSVGPLCLDETLSPGQFRELSQDELEAFC